jgi:hypothetical protein
MDWLNEHLCGRKKYFAIYKYVMKHFQEPNKKMQRILEKQKSQFFVWEDLTVIIEWDII